MYTRSIFWNILKLISNLYFSISLLLLLAFVSIFGTLIEQEQSLNYYQSHYPLESPVMSMITWKKILWLGLDHMYSTTWFLFLLVIFFLSLLVCTLSTQLPILKYSRQWSFLYNQESLEKKRICYKLKPASFLNLIYLLNISNYFVFHKGQGIYAYKGLIGRIAPIFVHASIIITFIGFILRMTGGLVVQEMVPMSESFHLQNITSSGDFSNLPNNTLGKVEDFFITFNNDKSIQQFYSNVSFLNSNRELLATQYISVNTPLRFKGLTIYQTDWQISSLRLQLGSYKFVVQGLKQIKFNSTDSYSIWTCDLAIDTVHKVSIVIPSMLDDILIYDQNGYLISQIQYGVWTVIYGVPILCKDLMVSTGLQCKVDPGLSVSYAGFFVLIISIIASYMSYSQVWANQTLDQISMSGNTNRALLLFEEELNYLFKKMEYLCLCKH